MIYLDYSQDYQLLFQDPASPMMNGIIDLHHYVMFFLFIIFIFVVTMLISVIELFLFSQTVKKFNYLYIDIVGSVNHAFKGIRKIERNHYVKNILAVALDQEKNLAIRRKITLRTQSNLFWTLLSSKYGYLTAYPFGFVKKKVKKVNLRVFITNYVSGKTIIQKCTPNSFFKLYSFKRKVNASMYLSNIFLLNRKYKSGFPERLISRTIKRLFYGTRKSYTIVNVYQTYTLNVYYWMQLYFNLRSGIQNFTHSTIIEIVWTIIPSLVLVCIGIPSFILLYAMDEIIEPTIIVKCIGHQWYWSYEIELNTLQVNVFYRESFEGILDLNSDDWAEAAPIYYEAIGEELDAQNIIIQIIVSKFHAFFFKPTDDIYNKTAMVTNYINFNSYMVPENELIEGAPRLLEVDNALYLPSKTHIDLLVTANDVIHCWTVPSFGIKMDAVPGRINHASLFIERVGTFYGQCSEICGVNHGFMPIKVISVDAVDYFNMYTSLIKNVIKIF